MQYVTSFVLINNIGGITRHINNVTHDVLLTTGTGEFNRGERHLTVHRVVYLWPAWKSLFGKLTNTVERHVTEPPPPPPPPVYFHCCQLRLPAACANRKFLHSVVCRVYMLAHCFEFRTALTNAIKRRVDMGLSSYCLKYVHFAVEPAKHSDAWCEWKLWKLWMLARWSEIFTQVHTYARYRYNRTLMWDLCSSLRTK